MQHPERLTRAARWGWHSLRLVPRFLRLRRQKRTAPPPAPTGPYRRFYSRDHSFAELVRRGKP